jgi:hypothetical protein
MSNIVPFRRKPVLLVWEDDDGRVRDRDGQRQIGPCFVANTADDRYEIRPCYRMKGSGWEFAACYSVECHWIDNTGTERVRAEKPVSIGFLLF